MYVKQITKLITTRINNLLGPYSLLILFIFVAVTLQSLSRIGLIIWQFDRIENTPAWPAIIWQGVRTDLITAGLFLILPTLLVPLLVWRKTEKIWQGFCLFWLVICLSLILFLEIATPTFISQYDIRPNRLFIEYLKYPDEVFAMLWQGFRRILVGGIIGVTVFSFIMVKLLKLGVQQAYFWSKLKILFIWPFVCFLVFIMVRSTTEIRPANPAMFAITSDSLVNSLMINSTWSVYFALYNLKHESQSSEAYGKLPLNDVLKIIRSQAHLTHYQFPLTDYPTVHYQSASVTRKKPLNLVIILEESLGATFVQSLGGKPVTPNLEKLKTEGWWFTNLFATGTRSVRGIEAVVSGYLPTPARSTVKLSKSQRNFTTIADILARQGYHTEFDYGGEAHFDNMRSFFCGNGFQSIVDQSDFDAPQFVASWGVSDQDLFNKVHQRMTKLHQGGKPFFNLVFSSSNHQPFEFPAGEIELYDSPQATVNNAVKYADHALAEFIKKAKKSDYWQDTLFLIVADHDSRVFGQDLVPVNKFHIPGLILGADIKPRQINEIVSQIDLAPTLLSLIGVSSAHPLIGRDLTQASQLANERAMMQFADNYAWLDKDGLVVLRPNQQPMLGQYNFADKSVSYSNEHPTQARFNQVLAHSLLPSILYRHQQYFVPQISSLPLSPKLSPQLSPRLSPELSTHSVTRLNSAKELSHVSVQ